MRILPNVRHFLIFFSLSAAAQDVDQMVTQAFELTDKGEFAKSLVLGKTIFDLQPYTPDAYNIIAFNQICLGNFELAEPYISTGLQVDPTNYSIHVNAGYYFALKGNSERAKQYFLESIKRYPEFLDIDLVLNEIRMVGSKLNQTALFDPLASYYLQTWKATKVRYPTMDKLSIDIQSDVQNNPEKVKQVTHQFVARCLELGWPDVAMQAYGHAAGWLQNYKHLSDAVEMAQAGYSLFLKKDFRNNYFLASYLLHQMASTYISLGNDERIVQHVNEVAEISNKLPLHYYDIRVFFIAAGSFSRLQNTQEEMKWATLGYNLAQKAGFSPLRVISANVLSVAMRSTDQGSLKAIHYGEEALQIAIQNKLFKEMESVISNLAIWYHSISTRESQEKAIRMLGMLVAIQESEKDYLGAALTLNNMGSMQYIRNDFEGAIVLFEKSVKLAESEIANLSMSASDKLSFYQSQVSAYQWLTSCYANLNNTEGAFRSMEGSRARVLGERLAKGKQVKTASIPDVQTTLGPDEAIIMYDLMSGHEVSILVITQKYSSVVFHKDENFIGTIKDKYFDKINKEHRERRGLANEKEVDRDLRVSQADFQRVTQLTRKFFERPGMADDGLDEFLRGYYRFLILPIQNKLSGVKKLILSPNDVLNYIPFEALKMYDGKYLIEKYEVKYIQSARVTNQIRERKYLDTRKPLLAMGGAQYLAMNVNAPEVKTQQDLNALQLEADANSKSGKSQRRIYAALFGTGPMNALPGTVEEIKNISAALPSAETYLGTDMTENKMKAMSKSGELGQYKVLHLATHGFVVNEIPDLSGVAMSIFEKEQDGEDGFLNVAEIVSLKLNTDLVVLSACQTALGKIYSGEGVTGLTQSLIIAGSKAALVSLWPVNDTSTMIFMSELYKESLKGKPYAQIVSELKKRFIKGEFGSEFKHPNYWAPFVYYGI